MYFEEKTGIFGSIFQTFWLTEIPGNIPVPGANSRSRFPKSHGNGNSRNPTPDPSGVARHFSNFLYEENYRGPGDFFKNPRKLKNIPVIQSLLPVHLTPFCPTLSPI